MNNSKKYVVELEPLDAKVYEGLAEQIHIPVEQLLTNCLCIALDMIAEKADELDEQEKRHKNRP